jgi:hypothetical protein
MLLGRSRPRVTCEFGISAGPMTLQGMASQSRAQAGSMPAATKKPRARRGQVRESFISTRPQGRPHSPDHSIETIDEKFRVSDRRTQFTRSNFHASIHGVIKSPNRTRTHDVVPDGVVRSSMSTMVPIVPRRTWNGRYSSSNRTLVPTKSGLIPTMIWRPPWARKSPAEAGPGVDHEPTDNS